jgi:hypothetical protein
VGTRLEKPFSLPALIQTIQVPLGQPTQTHLQATRQRTHLEPFSLKPTSAGLESQTRNCKEANV